MDTVFAAEYDMINRWRQPPLKKNKKINKLYGAKTDNPKQNVKLSKILW